MGNMDNDYFNRKNSGPTISSICLIFIRFKRVIIYLPELLSLLMFIYQFLNDFLYGIYYTLNILTCISAIFL